MKIAVYRIDTGSIVRIVKCTPQDAQLQAGEGEAFVECDDHFDHIHRVENGELVEIKGADDANQT